MKGTFQRSWAGLRSKPQSAWVWNKKNPLPGVSLGGDPSASHGRFRKIEEAVKCPESLPESDAEAAADSGRDGKLVTHGI